MNDLKYAENTKMMFRSRKTNEIVQIDVKNSIERNVELIKGLPMTSSIIKVDEEIENAKSMGLVSR